MTPVEERIDHEDNMRREWRGLRADLLAVRSHLTTPYPDDARWTPWDRFVGPGIERMQRAIDALLTEHSAREQALLKITFMDDAPLAQYLARRVLGLPATDSDQPPQNYQVDSIDAGADLPDAPEGDPPPGYVGPSGSGASE